MFLSSKSDAPIPAPSLVRHRSEDHEAAILFIHGFHGDQEDTWGDFPSYIVEDQGLAGWDVLSLGYVTNLRLDLARVWSSAAPLERLALLLQAVAEVHNYKSLALIAHSMGGLIVQRALLDDAELRSKTSHVLLFGTPSAGLAKAGLVKFWKRQLRDMASGSSFIEGLRADWQRDFGEEAPFKLLSVAGSEDEFVPPESSLEPFPADQRAVVHGDHLAMVKPSDAGNLSLRLAVSFLVGDAAPAGPWNSARVAVETQDFRSAIQTLEPHKDELDEHSLVSLALAMDAVGRQEEAIELLEKASDGSRTDAMGVLAGRLKRRWLAEGREMDAERAYALYSEARSLATDDGVAEQAYYQGINCAFMEACYLKDRKKAKTSAKVALHNVWRSETKDRWALATEAEAFLYLDEVESAISKYRQAVSATISPREVESMFLQATTVASRLGDYDLVKRLTKIMRPDLDVMAAS